MLGRVRTTTRADDLGACDLIIEAATENETLKEKILRNVDAIARPGTIIATNTSSISITKLAASLKDPQRFVGMHFFNPVPVMALVEIIRGLRTSDETVGRRHQRWRSDWARRRSREEQRRLRRQPHPVPDDQRGDLRAAGRAGERRGDRRRHEARLQSPDRARSLCAT